MLLTLLRRWYRFFRFLICLLTVVGVVQTSVCHAQRKVESLKAAYIYYFVRFTEWHYSVKRNDSDTTILCYDASDRLLEKELAAIAQKSKNDRSPLEVLVLDNVSSKTISRCDMSYFSNENYAQLIEEGFSDLGLLTITDASGEHYKGIINFSLENSRLGFEINRAKARESKLTISSKLLSLAKKVVN